MNKCAANNMVYRPSLRAIKANVVLIRLWRTNITILGFLSPATTCSKKISLGEKWTKLSTSLPTRKLRACDGRVTTKSWAIRQGPLVLS